MSFMCIIMIFLQYNVLFKKKLYIYIYIFFFIRRWRVVCIPRNKRDIDSTGKEEKITFGREGKNQEIKKSSFVVTKRG
jgi:hypothetical protein